MTLTLMDWFCGAGGSSQGAHAVPGVTVSLAANHWDLALASHAENFGEADHWQGDIRTAPVADWPVADLFWASPECPQWSNARGKTRDYHTQDTLPGLEPETDVEAERSRALMEEVPMYLAGVQRRGGLVTAGVVENVVEVRSWIHWDRWLKELDTLGYNTRVIAMNSMHAHGTTTPQAPQSRDRLYLAYWHRSIGRTPDWDKWLRPTATCEQCGPVSAVQSWKRPDADMGRYRTQYVYRCPTKTCRGRAVEPAALPAAAAIDWTLPAQRLGDRARPLADATMGRIRVGMKRFWDGMALPPMVVTLRGGGSRHTAATAAEPLGTMSAGGQHHALVGAPHMLVPYYGQPLNIEDVRFRMLAPAEIGRAMAFGHGYTVLGNKRQQVRQYGNAVTPPVAELIVSALAEAVTGEALERQELACEWGVA